MKCISCMHNEVCKYKTDYTGIKSTREEIVQNYDGWDMYEIKVNCNAYKEDEEFMMIQELAKQYDETIEEVF